MLRFFEYFWPLTFFDELSILNIMDDRLYWLGFSAFPGIGPKRFKLLLERFGSAKNAWESSSEELEVIIGKAWTEKFALFQKQFDFEKQKKILAERKVGFITLLDSEYPQLLKEIHSPPFILYIKSQSGLYGFNQESAIGVVGTRKITTYGREVTEQITQELVAAGYTIVSGLAYGVDATAHTVTIENKGKTIAVLGCGVDCCYPRANQSIYTDIILKGGAIVSEFPPGMQPSVGSFPSRNRIIAGLSQAVIVTEGAADSGALYTAEDAFSLKRPVFAVPGPITSNLSKGPHSLVGKGAHLITSVSDILPVLRGGRNRTSTKKVKGDTKEEQDVVLMLENENLHFDEIVKKLNKDSAAVGVLLSMMEMKGMIKSSDGGIFRL